MPTKRFTNLQQMGPIEAEVDANGDVVIALAGAVTDPVSGESLSIFDTGTADQNSALVAGGYHTLVQSTSVVAALDTIDCANFAWISVQVTSIGTSPTAALQCSNDGITWQSAFLYRVNGSYDVGQSTANVATIYHGPVAARYFRINVTALAAGTYAATIVLSTIPRQLHSIGAGVNIAQVNGSSLAIGDARGTGSIVPVAGLLSNGATFDAPRSVTTLKTAQSTALASGSALALWTPAVGKRWRLRTVRGRASVAGRYEIRDGAVTVIGYIYLDANRWITISDMEANGYLSTTVNNVLNIYNVTGSPADLDFIASGNEE